MIHRLRTSFNLMIKATRDLFNRSVINMENFGVLALSQEKSI